MAKTNKQLAQLLADIKSGKRKLETELAFAEAHSHGGGGRRLPWQPVAKDTKLIAGFYYAVATDGNVVRLPLVDDRGFNLHTYYHDDSKVKAKK